MKKIWDLRKAVLCNTLEEIVKQKEKTVAIRDSRKLYEELQSFTRYDVDNDTHVNYNPTVNNSYIVYSTESFDCKKPIFVKIKINNKVFGIHCIDNLIDKIDYKNKVRALSDKEFIDFVKFLNANKIKYTIASSYFKRFEEYLPKTLVYYRKQDSLLTNTIKSILDRGTNKYGLLLTKENYNSPKVYSYDINSAYPAALKKYGVIKTVKEIHNYKQTVALKQVYFGVFKITDGQLKNNKTPFQGINNDRRISSGMYNPNWLRRDITFKDFKENNYIGILTSIDIDYLEESYTNLKYEFIEGYEVEFYRSNEIDIFIDSIYAQKQTVAGLQKMIVKTGYNALIGCFSINCRSENYLLKISHLFTLTYVREQMRRTIDKIKELNYEFIGCDTDSIKTDMPIEEFEKIAPVGKEIGEFKFEHCFIDFYQHKTKQYCGYENNELVIVCAGDKDINIPILLENYSKAWGNSCFSYI